MVGFVKTTGGKPELSSAQFIANYVIKRKQDALVFQLMDPVNGRYPLFIDIDLDFMGQATFDEDQMRHKHLETAAHIAKVLRRFCTNGMEFEVVMSKRPGYYKGVKKVRQDKEWKEVEVSREGFHVWFPNVKLRQDQALKVRNALISDDTFDFDEHYGTESEELGWWVSKEDIYDKALFQRKNGLYIIGQKKPAAKTAHELFYKNSINKEHEWGKDPILRFTEEARIATCKRLYKFLFAQKPPKAITVAKKKRGRPKKEKKVIEPEPVPPPPTEEPTHGTLERFSLGALLEALPSVNHAMYKTIVAYLAYRGMDPNKAQRMCNGAWNPPADKVNETGEFMRRMTVFKVRKNELLKALKGVVSKQQLNEIFPTVYTFLTDVVDRYANKLIDERDLKQSYLDAVVMIGVGDKTRFRWNETYNGQLYTDVSKKPPYSTKYDSFTYYVEELDEEGVTKRIKKNSGKLITGLSNDRMLKAYMKVDFIPCGPDDGSVECPPGVLNEWTGFHMEFYKAHKPHTCDGDPIDVFLDEVYGKVQKKFLFDLWSYYIVKPGHRTGRLTVCKGDEGSGKTTLFHILELILGRKLCKKSNDIVAYLSKFNNSFRARKVIWLDDVYGVTFAQVRKLMPKATSQTEEYEPKGLPRYEVNEVSELWFSGNQDSPISTTAKSRRDLIFETNNTWVGNCFKFNKLYECMRNMDVGKAWFEKLRTRDLKSFNPRTQQPETEVRFEVNKDSMTPVHQFLAEFFVNKWFDRYKWKHFTEDPYLNLKENYTHIAFPTTVSVAITLNLFQHWIREWMHENTPNRRKLSRTSVVKQMKLIGFVVRRGHYFENRRESFGITFDVVQEYSRTGYGLEIEPWWHDTNRVEALRIINSFSD